MTIRTSDTGKRTLTTGQVAARCEVSIGAVKKWIRRGKLRATKTPGGHFRVLADEFERFRAAYRFPPAAPGPKRPAARGGGRAGRMAETAPTGPEAEWTPELAQAGDLVVRTVLRLLHARQAALERLDRASGRLVIVAAAGDGETGSWIGRASPSNHGLTGRAVAERRLICSPDLLNDPTLVLPPGVVESLAGDDCRSAVAVPLMSGAEVLGGLFVGDVGGRVFQEAELGLLAAFADCAAAVLENARLHAGALGRVRQLAGLVDVNRTLTGTLDPRRVAAAVLEAAQTLLPDCAGHLWELLPGQDELRLVETRGLRVEPDGPSPRRRLGEGLVGKAVLTRAPVLCTEAREDSRARYKEWLAAEGMVSAIALPLLHAGAVWGVLSLFTRMRHEFLPDEVGLLESFAAQAAAAVANARLHAETVQGRRESEILAGLTHGIGASLDLDTVLQRVAEAARELCRADQSHIAVADPGGAGMEVRYWAGARSESWKFRIEPGRGIGGQVLTTGRPFRTDDYATDPRITRDYLGPALAEGVVSVLAVPIQIGGLLEGLLFVANRTRRPFGDAEEAILLRLADHAAIAIRNAGLHEETERRLRETEGLLGVAHTVGESLDPAEIARRAARQTTLLLGGDTSIVFGLDDDGEHATAIAGYHVPPALRQSAFRVPVAEFPPVVREAIRSGRPVATTEVGADPRCDHPLFRTMAVPPRSMLLAPLLSRGQVRGAILTYWWTEARRITAEELRLVQGVTAHTVLALDNARLYAQSQRALEDLKAAQERVVRGETLRALGELAGGAAHHLNNLLAIIYGRVQLLLRHEEAEARRRPLEVVERAARDAADVVRRLQRFAQAEPVGRLERLDLNELAAEVVEMTRVRWHDVAEAQGVQIGVTLQRGELPVVHGDPVALREAIMNLVLNAVDALPEGGRVTLATRSEGSLVALSVTDTGVGMTDEVRLRAREPFFTTKGVKSTGLGLSVSYGVIERHAGDLVIESALGRGTAVTIRLPAAVPAPPPRVVPIASLPVRPQRILVIEDSAQVRELLATLLAEQGHTVTAAVSGPEGLATLESGRAVDLVLTDLGMPEMTGWQVARAVKARWPGIRVGIVTGWGEHPTATAAERASADFVLAKPVSAEALERALAG